MNYYHIAVCLPLQNTLIYQSKKKIPIGSVVWVNIGSRKKQGLIVAEDQKPVFQVKSILEVEDQYQIDAVRLKWIRWIADYYFYPIGQVAASCMLSKKIKEFVSLSSYSSLPLLQDVCSLNKDQDKCFRRIRCDLDFNVHLLHGVTGSGKTEVYLQLIQEQLKKNQSVLVLVPEISLTSQLFSRFESRFPDSVALFHSNLTTKQRSIEWMSVVKGHKKILLGARSALFCPIPKLSMIILDEEHEAQFKQEEKLKYHARDASIMLAKMYRIPIVLGSATPSLETWLNAKNGKYLYHTLKNRFKNYPMPKIQLIDLKKENQFNKTNQNQQLPFWLSRSLFQSIQQTLKDKKQVALFLNRRGQSSVSLCSECGQPAKCLYCDVSLTLHSGRYLVCHYCNYSTTLEGFICSICKSKEVFHAGIGTQGVFDEICQLFPDVHVQLADSDHIQDRDHFKTIITNMEQKKIDILIGTQMIAKGLDFSGLHLVGFILADLVLYHQDFRSSERCFQVITQMGGRSGRHSMSAGQVLVQTYNPDHYSIQASVNMQFEKMAEQELLYRKKLNYPPYCRLTVIQVSATQKHQAQEVARVIASKIRNLSDLNFECLGESPASIFKLRSRYRYHILIKTSSVQVMHQLCQFVLALVPELPSSVRLQINRDS